MYALVRNADFVVVVIRESKKDRQLIDSELKAFYEKKVQSNS